MESLEDLICSDAYQVFFCFSLVGHTVFLFSYKGNRKGRRRKVMNEFRTYKSVISET